MCIFKHSKKNRFLNEEGFDENEKNEIFEIKSYFDDDKQEDFDDDEEEGDIDEQDEGANKTFINNTQVENTYCDLIIKGNICDFQASSRSEFTNHKTKSHNW